MDGQKYTLQTDRKTGYRPTHRQRLKEAGRQRQTDGDRQRQLDRIHTPSGLFTCFIVPVAPPLTTDREGVTSSPSHKMTTTTPLNSLPNDLISNIGLEWFRAVSAGLACFERPICLRVNMAPGNAQATLNCASGLASGSQPVIPGPLLLRRRAPNPNETVLDWYIKCIQRLSLIDIWNVFTAFGFCELETVPRLTFFFFFGLLGQSSHKKSRSQRMDPFLARNGRGLM